MHEKFSSLLYIYGSPVRPCWTILLQSSIYSKVLFFFLYYSLLYYYSFLSLLLNSFIFIFNLLFFLSFFGTQMLKEDRSKRRIKRFVTLHQCPSLHNSIYTSIESQLSILLFLHFGLAIVQYEIACDAIGAWGCGGCAGDESAERERDGGSIRLPYIYTTDCSGRRQSLTWALDVIQKFHFHRFPPQRMCTH